MAVQPVRPIGGTIETMDKVTPGATISHGRFGVVDPADGTLKAIDATVLEQVVVVSEDATSGGDPVTVYTRGVFITTNSSGGALHRGDYVVPSSTDPQGVDGGSAGDVQVLRVVGPTDEVADGGVLHVELTPDYGSAGTV